ncbi:MAG TPA: helix-turn-helix transcriptional regulator [Candidatus Saccharimonadia bacterium]|nr:helix-turn-helix transcriptional regulator [Candidatus Saccharimonadia bacterium]
MADENYLWQNEAQARTELDKIFAEAKRKRDELWSQRQAFLASLYRARQQKGLSQSGLAKKVGTTQSVISRIEAGKGNPGLNMLMKIAKALNANLMLE